MKYVTRNRVTPYRLNYLTRRDRFRKIADFVSFTNIGPPSFINEFCKVIQIVPSWNHNTRQIFTPGWIKCLGESMSICTNKCTCAVFLLRYHTPGIMNIIASDVD